MTNNDAYTDRSAGRTRGRRTIAIIGAGASGLACAVSCAQALEAACLRAAVDIVVLESSHNPGRSILASGNGRCNFSNARIYATGGEAPAGPDADAGLGAADGAGAVVGLDAVAGVGAACGSTAAECGYRNAPFVDQVRAAAQLRGLPTALEWLTGLGLVWEEKPHSGGLLYPFSNKSRTVVDVLLHACERHRIKIVQGATVERIATAAAGRFIVSGTIERIDAPDDGASRSGKGRKGGKGGRKPARHFEPCSLECDAAVVAVGKAVREGRVWHKLLPGQPAVPMRMVLGPLRTNRQPIQGLDGVRMQARVSVPERGFVEEGEVLFRTYGISGIVVFDASRHAQPGDAVVLDLAPAWEPDQLERLLQARAASLSFEPASTPASQPGYASSAPLLSDVLRGMVDPPVAAAVCRMAGEDPAAAATPARCQAVARAFKGFRLQCEGVAEDQPCQVMRGGCAVEGVDPATLETLEQPRLYVLGEALDVDAPCGGFNLDWAWTCGIVAGHALARHVAADDERTRL